MAEEVKSEAFKEREDNLTTEWDNFAEVVDWLENEAKNGKTPETREKAKNELQEMVHHMERVLDDIDNLYEGTDEATNIAEKRNAEKANTIEEGDEVVKAVDTVGEAAKQEAKSYSQVATTLEGQKVTIYGDSPEDLRENLRNFYEAERDRKTGI